MSPGYFLLFNIFWQMSLMLTKTAFIKMQENSNVEIVLQFKVIVLYLNIF